MAGAAHRSADKLVLAGRVILAAVGGFLFSSMLALGGASLLIAGGIASRGGAVHALTLSTWLVWCAVAMMAFHVRRPVRFTGWLMLVSALFAVPAVLIGWGLPT
jgi:hypothetical protein